ncbi:MAG: DUF3857 domain-containing protein [Bacteroidota bacterium]
MKNSISFVFIILLVVLSPAQDLGPRLSDFQREYPNFPDSEAIILEETTQLRINSGGFLKTYSLRVHILKAEAIETFANQTLTYFPEHEAYTQISATCYNAEENGVQVVRLKMREIYDKKVEEELREIAFAIPKVGVGSIIELSYELSDDRIFQHIHYFQNFYPTLKSSFTFHQSPRHGYSTFLQGIFQERLDKKVRGTMTTFTMEDVPAAKEEAFVPNIDDYRSKLTLQLAEYMTPEGIVRKVLSNWPDFTKNLMKESSFTQYKRGPKTILKSLNITSFKGKSEEETIHNIFYYVRDRMIWNGAFRIGTEKKLKDSFQEAYGSSSDINQLLIFLLQEAGVDAKPMITSTRGNGNVNKKWPIFSEFNIMVAYVETHTRDYVLDATLDVATTDYPPSYLINQDGWVLDSKHKDGGMWHKIQTDVPMKKQLLVATEIDNEGIVQAKVTEIRTGYYGDFYRSQTKKDLQAYIEDQYQEGSLAEFSIEPREKDRGIKMIYKLELEEYARQAGDLLFLSPWLGFGQKENPFDTPQRLFPIDFGIKGKKQFSSLLNIPEGYQIESLPDPVHYSLPNQDISFFFQVEPIQDQIQVQSIWTINRTTFDPSSFQSLKKLYDKIIQAQQSQIILRKVRP